MRIGKQKQVLEAAIGESSQLQLTHEAIFGGQAYLVGNFDVVAPFIDSIKDSTWHDGNFETIQDIMSSHDHASPIVQLSQAEFNQLNNYLSAVNTKLPVFQEILKEFSYEQSEQVINIKLPERVDSLDDLSELSKRLSTLFKQFNIDGQVEFVGFDRGTSWIIVIAAGVATHQFILAGLDIAKRFFEAREAYFKSETARVDYEVAAKKEEGVTEEEYREFVEERLERLVKEQVKEAVEKIDFGTRNQNETITNVLGAVKKLITEIDEQGTEFHLSLNPPSFADEKNGSVTIDYSKLPSKDKKTKALKAKESEEQESA